MRPYRENTQLLVYLFCWFTLVYAALIVPRFPKNGDRYYSDDHLGGSLLTFYLFIPYLHSFICLINVCSSLSDEANNKTKSLNWENIAISVISENLSITADIPNRISWAHKRFCQPALSQFLTAAIFFVTDCKELKLAPVLQCSN